ncbi:MAG TPA: DUF3892 domain-containing protein [Acidimicrobiales bacterium]|nr:DUF3892 domain-containing protein [Acidimicrobiales bacterium]
MSTGTSTITVRIGCIRKNPRTDPHLRIRGIGGVNPNGTRWSLTLDEAIAGIEAGKYSFYVEAAGRRVQVVVAKSAHGHKYLKTVADGEQPNNLLALPECP